MQEQWDLKESDQVHREDLSGPEDGWDFHAGRRKQFLEAASVKYPAGQEKWQKISWNGMQEAGRVRVILSCAQRGDRTAFL